MANDNKQQLLDQRYLQMADTWSQNSYCKRSHVEGFSGLGETVLLLARASPHLGKLTSRYNINGGHQRSESLRTNPKTNSCAAFILSPSYILLGIPSNCIQMVLNNA